MRRARRWVGVLAAGLTVGAFRAPAVVRSPLEEPSEVWRAAGHARGSPAVDEDTAYFLSTPHQLVAVDLATGEGRWTADTGGGLAETLGTAVLVVGSTVVAGDYDVTAFDRETGERRWTFAPVEGRAPGVYLGDADETTVYAGSAAGVVHAIDGVSGRARWSVAVGEGTVFAPRIAGDVVVAAMAERSGRVSPGAVGLDRDSGRVLWRTQLAPGDAGSAAARMAADAPVVIGRLAIVTTRDGTVHAIDARTGVVGWRLARLASMPDGRDGPAQDVRPVVRAGSLLVAGSLTGTIVAYQLPTRHEVWRRAPLPVSVAFGLAADAGRIYVPYLSGDLVALDARTGNEIWRAGGPEFGRLWTPVAAGSRLLVAASRAGLLAFHQ